MEDDLGQIIPVGGVLLETALEPAILTQVIPRQGAQRQDHVSKTSDSPLSLMLAIHLHDLGCG